MLTNSPNCSQTIMLQKWRDIIKHRFESNEISRKTNGERNLFVLVTNL